MVAETITWSHCEIGSEKWRSHIKYSKHRIQRMDRTTQIIICHMLSSTTRQRRGRRILPQPTTTSFRSLFPLCPSQSQHCQHPDLKHNESSILSIARINHAPVLLHLFPPFFRPAHYYIPQLVPQTIRRIFCLRSNFNNETERKLTCLAC